MSVPMDMVRPGKDNFVLQVEGNSMIDEQIRDGDYIVVSSQPTASDGEVVVALVGGDVGHGQEALPGAREPNPPSTRQLRPWTPSWCRLGTWSCRGSWSVLSVGSD